jgi:hypothetical protein
LFVVAVAVDVVAVVTVVNVVVVDAVAVVTVATVIVVGTVVGFVVTTDVITSNTGHDFQAYSGASEIDL